MEVEAWSFRISGLYDVARAVMEHGEEASPRGQKTRELLGFTLRLREPEDTLLNGEVRPKFSPGIAAAEAAQLIGGVSDPALMVRVSKNFGGFLNGGSFLGAYGPRVRTQLPEIVNRLKQDASSRQAVVSIWRPQDDLWAKGARDVPCTVTLQFFLRNDRLHMHTYMRSNDVWWGLSYDAFQFTQLQCTLANVLEVDTGHYVHTAGSMHIYERDFDNVAEIAHPSRVSEEVPTLVKGFGGYDFADIYSAMDNASEVVDGVRQNHRAITDSIDWYWSTLEKYRV